MPTPVMRRHRLAIYNVLPIAWLGYVLHDLDSL
jgi:hypothetical protein